MTKGNANILKIINKTLEIIKNTHFTSLPLNERFSNFRENIETLDIISTLNKIVIIIITGI